MIVPHCVSDADAVADAVADLDAFPLQAPEVFARNFGTQADMWSLGMLAYQMLSNRCMASNVGCLYVALLARLV